MKLTGTDILFFLIICIALWFTNKQHDHIVYLEDTIKIQDKAISQQLFLIECQNIVLKKPNHSSQPQTFYEQIPFYKKTEYQ
jgi:hypothetical protein